MANLPFSKKQHRQLLLDSFHSRIKKSNFDLAVRQIDEGHEFELFDTLARKLPPNKHVEARRRLIDEVIKDLDLNEHFKVEIRDPPGENDHSKKIESIANEMHELDSKIDVKKAIKKLKEDNPFTIGTWKVFFKKK